MIKYLLSLSNIKKKVILLIFDTVSLWFCLWLAFSLRYGYWYVLEYSGLPLFALTTIIALPIFIKLGLYRSIVRYLSSKFLQTIIVSISLFVLVWSASLFVFNYGAGDVPRSVPFIYWLLLILLVGGSRVLAKTVFAYDLHNVTNRNVVIYGAGKAGRQLSLSLSHGGEFKHLSFVDDDKSLWGRKINGRNVYDPAKLPRIINKYNISDVILAMPNINKKLRNNIENNLQSLRVKVQVMPNIEELASGNIKVDELKEVDILNLLCRDIVVADKNLLLKNIQNKVVLVTGAGGSIGSEICRQVVANSADILILFELNEYALYSIDQELKNSCTDVVPILGNVQNKSFLESICKKYKVQTIYHAAAYKHVPMVEANAYEGLVNNVLGTLNVAQAAHSQKIESMVLISTDKAVRPTNIMGATKRFAELVLQAMAKHSIDTVFTMVRFGNVLGSSGSVVPLFKKQIAKGGPVTVTDPEVTRFFMMIPEAVELVIQAGAMGEGGEVFVLDMGNPVKILDIAKKMINLSGYSELTEDNPDGDIAIEFMGLRPGEKLYEELLIGDNDQNTENERIFKAIESTLAWEELKSYLDEIPNIRSTNDVKKLLSMVVPEYIYSKK